MNHDHIQNRYGLVIGVSLIIITFSLYYQVKNFDFINFDDEDYVVQNPYVKKGITGESVKWAFTAFYAGNWHPLTWLSHMIDCELFGLDAGKHHLTNVVFHILNTLLLFIVLKKFTGAIWQSGFVAMLFAIHPLHVESVAWISERKDVLSTFFFLLALWSYLSYVRRHQFLHYLFTMGWFLCGLMSKPMLVTFPFVLLLLDYYPLRRFHHFKTDALKLVIEKIPFMVVCVISSGITILAQRKGGAVSSFELHPLGLRLQNAIHSYVQYIKKTVVPIDLTIYYPYPAFYSLIEIIGAILFLFSITVLAILLNQKYPWFLMGWLWYVGTLVPVIGIVQVGSQAMADRYSYIPLIGIFIIIAGVGNELYKTGKIHAKPIGILCFFIILYFCSLTYIQIQFWENSIRLFRHALEVNPNNGIAHNNLGAALGAQGKISEAIYHFSESVRITPDNKEAWQNLGFAMELQGKIPEAIQYYKKALAISSDLKKAHINLGKILAHQGSTDEAKVHFQQALRLDPDNPEVHHELGLIFANQQQPVVAIHHFQTALQFQPDNVQFKNNLAVAMISVGNVDGAIKLFQEILDHDPDNELAKQNLKMALEDKAKMTSDTH